MYTYMHNTYIQIIAYLNKELSKWQLGMQTAENSPPAINDSGTGRRHIPVSSTSTTRKPLGGSNSSVIGSATSSRHLFNMSNDDIYKYTSQLISGSIPTPLKTPYTPTNTYTTNTYTNSSIKVTPSTTYTRAGGVDFIDPYDQTIPSIATQVATSTNNASTNQQDKGHNADPYSPNMEIYKQGLKNLGLENESMSSVLDGLEVINTTATTNTNNTSNNTSTNATNTNNNNAYKNNNINTVYNKQQQQQYEYEVDSAFLQPTDNTQLDVLEMMDYYSTGTTPISVPNVTAGRNPKSASFSGSGLDFSGSGLDFSGSGHNMNLVTPVSGGGGVDRYGIM